MAFSKAAGYYNLGGVQFYLDKKPSAFNRWMVRRFFGWVWVDNPANGKGENE